MHKITKWLLGAKICLYIIIILFLFLSFIVFFASDLDNPGASYLLQFYNSFIDTIQSQYVYVILWLGYTYALIFLLYGFTHIRVSNFLFKCKKNNSILFVTILLSFLILLGISLVHIVIIGLACADGSCYEKGYFYELLLMEGKLNLPLFIFCSLPSFVLSINAWTSQEEKNCGKYLFCLTLVPFLLALGILLLEKNFPLYVLIPQLPLLSLIPSICVIILFHKKYKVRVRENKYSFRQLFLNRIIH